MCCDKALPLQYSSVHCENKALLLQCSSVHCENKTLLLHCSRVHYRIQSTAVNFDVRQLCTQCVWAFIVCGGMGRVVEPTLVVKCRKQKTAVWYISFDPLSFLSSSSKCTLWTPSLYDNDICDDGMRYLSDALNNCTTLQKLRWVTYTPSKMVKCWLLWQLGQEFVDVCLFVCMCTCVCVM